MKVCVSGHRPAKLGGYSQHVTDRLFDLAKAVLEYHLNKGYPEPIDSIITGMALGWDQAIAEACLCLNIPFIAAIPFVEQPNKWPLQSQRKYFQLTSKAQSIHVLGTKDRVFAAMNKRNRWMVDNSSMVLALYDGGEGGTKNCLDYAQSKRRLIINYWTTWLKHRDEKHRT